MGDDSDHRSINEEDHSTLREKYNQVVIMVKN